MNVERGADVIAMYPDLANLHGCTIGSRTRIGPFVQIPKNSDIGCLSSHPGKGPGAGVPGHGMLDEQLELAGAVQQDLGCRVDGFPVSERLARETLSLPIDPEVTTRDVQHLCDGLSEIREHCNAEVDAA